MRKNISSRLFIVFIIFALFSCKSKKSLVNQSNSTTNPPEVSNKIGLKSLQANQLDFTTFSTKAATLLDLNGKSYDVTLSLRIKKNEMIWASITVIAGVEVARVLITPDSIQVMDRINAEHLKKPFQFVQSFTNKHVDYATLEALLVGNCIPFTLNEKSEITKNDDVVTLTGILENLSYQLKFNQDLKVNETLLEDKIASQMLNVNNQSYEIIDGRPSPLKLLIDSEARDKKIKVAMEYSKTTLNAVLDYPFNVPKRFSVIN